MHLLLKAQYFPWEQSRLLLHSLDKNANIRTADTITMRTITVIPNICHASDMKWILQNIVYKSC